MNNKSEARAREIISTHLGVLEGELSKELLSVILVGSLANGSYTGNAGSDIDLIHVLKDNPSAGLRNQVKVLIEKTESLTDYDLPIAKCIYGFSQMKRPFRYDFELCLGNKDLIELPIEILRIKDSGLTIWGKDIIDLIDSPVRADIIYSKKLSILWGEKEKEKNPELYEKRTQFIENPPPRILLQSIIVNAMLDYYFLTGKSCSSKKEIGKRLELDVGKYVFQELLDLCITYRYNPEKVSPQQELWMRNRYNDWREIRRDKEIGDTEHLLAD